MSIEIQHRHSKFQLARHFRAHRAKRPVRLIAFNLEEYGLVGSEIYTNQLAAQQEKIHLILSFYLRNPHYHQPTDTIDTLDLDFMAGICRGLQAGIDRL